MKKKEVKGEETFFPDKLYVYGIQAWKKYVPTTYNWRVTNDSLENFQTQK